MGVKWWIQGKYFDPQHPDEECDRTVKRSEDRYSAIITGRDSKDGPVWTATAKPGGKFPERGQTLVFDFSSKGGSKEVTGVWTGNGWEFPDGNRWWEASMYDAGLIGPDVVYEDMPEDKGVDSPEEGKFFEYPGDYPFPPEDRERPEE